MRKFAISLTALVVMVVADGAWASTNTEITLYPSDVGDGSPAVGAPGTFAPGFNTGSIQANGSAYSKFFVTPQQLFGRDVTIGELANVSYWTKKDTLHTVSVADWYFQMYTEPYEGSPGSTWYGNRINSEPYFSNNLTETAGAWNEWSATGTTNQLRFYDSSTGYYGSNSDGFLSDLTSNQSYADQPIMYFDLGTGTAWADGFTGNLDGLTITLTDNSVGKVNFEAEAPVPEPLTMLAVLLGVGGLGGYLRRRKLA